MPRNLNEQVVVITGASSGIGRVTARMFASRGARVVVGSRNIEALNDLVREIDESGGVALAVQTDVTRRDQVERLAESAINHFGCIDTWVNNAGVSIYATFDKLADDEIRRVMDVNFMGTVYGMQAALSAMRASGGTIINVASVAGKRAIPLQNVYSASKFAVVGISEAVRSEIINEGLDINVCTVCPPSINTPFFDHARTKEGFAPKPPAPVYEPETVAEAIISCAERPEREVLIGSAGKGFAIINTLAPALADWFFGKAGRALQLTDEPKSESAQANLFNVVSDAREHGGWTVWGTRASNGHATGSIVRQHPLVASAVGAAALVVATRLLSRKF
jgi:short-subunit dehydrogenase